MYTWVHYFRKDGGHLPLVVREDVLESPESLENLMRCVELCGGQSSSDLLEPRADTTRDAALLARGIAHVFYNSWSNLRQLTEHLLPVQTATATSSWGARPCIEMARGPTPCIIRVRFVCGWHLDVRVWWEERR